VWGWVGVEREWEWEAAGRRRLCSWGCVGEVRMGVEVGGVRPWGGPLK